MKKLIWFLVLMLFIDQVSAEEIKLISGLYGDTQGSRIAKRLIETIEQRSGLIFAISDFSLKRSHHIFGTDNGKKYNGALIFLDGVEKTVPNVVKVPEVFIQSPIVAVVVNSNLKVNGWESLKGYKLVHQNGLKIVELFLRKYNLKSHSLRGAEQGLKSIKSRRAEVFVSPSLLVMGTLKKTEFKDKGFKVLKPPIVVCNFYSYFYKPYESIAKTYNEVLKEMKKDGSYEKILTTTP